MSPRVRQEIDMTMVKSFIRYVGVVSFTVLVITLIGLMLATKSAENVIIYSMVIGINTIVILGAFLASKLLKDK
jgi:nucleoside recognition membrane protein YjiH